jgi:hypothetical protein
MCYVAANHFYTAPASIDTVHNMTKKIYYKQKEYQF